MRTIANALACCALLLTLCGCGVLDKEPYRKVFYYDVPMPPPLEAPASYEISVSSELPSSPKMLFKTGPNRFEYDEYNRWVAAPDVLLKRRLERSLQASLGGRLLKVEIKGIEMDAASLKASCSVSFRIEGAGQPATGCATASASAKAGDAGAFAAAMGEVFDSLSSSLATELEKAGQPK